MATVIYFQDNNNIDDNEEFKSTCDMSDNESSSDESDVMPDSAIRNATVSKVILNYNVVILLY